MIYIHFHSHFSSMSWRHAAPTNPILACGVSREKKGGRVWQEGAAPARKDAFPSVCKSPILAACLLCLMQKTKTTSEKNRRRAVGRGEGIEGVVDPMQSDWPADWLAGWLDRYIQQGRVARRRGGRMCSSVFSDSRDGGAGYNSNEHATRRDIRDVNDWFRGVHGLIRVHGGFS